MGPSIEVDLRFDAPEQGLHHLQTLKKVCLRSGKIVRRCLLRWKGVRHQDMLAVPQLFKRLFVAGTMLVN